MATRASRLTRNCLGSPYSMPINTECRTGRDIALYLAVLCNSVEILGAAVDYTPSGEVVRLLSTYGGAAYNKTDKTWHQFISVSPRRKYGILPRDIKLKSIDGDEWSEIIDTELFPEICVFPANAVFYPVIDKIAESVVSLQTVEDNISQNLANLRELSVVLASSQKIKTQLEVLNRMRLSGATTGVIDVTESEEKSANALGQSLDDFIRVISLSPNAHNYLPDYLALKTDYREELSKLIGVASVGEKEERRVVSEMEIIENSSYAFIDIIIDSINEYGKLHNVDIYAHRRHSACEQHIAAGSTEEGAEAQILDDNTTVIEEEGGNEKP